MSDDDSRSRSKSPGARRKPRSRSASGERAKSGDGSRNGYEGAPGGARGGGGGGGDRDGNSGPREDGVSLLVRNLTYKVDKEELRGEFGKHGRVVDVYVPVDYVSREPRGFAFLEMGNKADADAALAALDGHTIDGRVIKVLFAANKRKRPDEMSRMDPRRGGGDDFRLQRR